MEPDTFINFAYGSNMSTARLRDRCPSAMPLGVAELTGYQLHWHKRSGDGSGKCDIIAKEKPGARVFGVLYQIASSEQGALDNAEGLGKGYEEIEVEVLCKGKSVLAKAYQATDTSSDLKPYSWYHAFVVAGAKEHGLSQDYVETLEKTLIQEDPDRDRHVRNMSLLTEVSA